MAIRARDDEFQALFGECEDADEIEQIINNDPALVEFCPANVDALTAEAWQRLGSYIAGNEHLRGLDLSDCNLDASKFRGLLMAGAALRRITTFRCRRNRGIDSTCFELLLNAMDGGAVEIMSVGGCNIENPMALARCTLPNLRSLFLDDNGITNLPPEALAKLTHLEGLDLGDNKIEENGFRAIANLLRKQDCGLEYLILRSTGMGEAGAEILAESLKCNTKLESLHANENDIGERGMGAFLKLLNDVSSIKKTETSNHTLQSLGLSKAEDLGLSHIKGSDMMACLNLALRKNSAHRGDPEAAGKAKVRDTQLCRSTREEVARLQGIECPSYHQLFSDLDAVLLPNILELVNRNNRYRNELYPVVVAKASDLVSLIDREAMIRGEKAKNDARIAAITAELAWLNVVNTRLESQLISIEAGESEGDVLGSKRSRDAAT